MGSERESVKCPIWRGLERLRPAAGRRLARQSLFSEAQIQRWRPVLWGRTFHASRRSWKESSHPIDSSWVGIPARLIAGTLGGIGIPHRAPWLGRSVPTKAAGIPWLPNGENPSIPRRLKNPECCHQTRPLSPETLRPGRPSLAPQSTRTKPFKPEPNERTSLYSFLRRAEHIRSRNRRTGGCTGAGSKGGGSTDDTTRSSVPRLPHVELLHLVAQRIPRDAQQERGLRLVAFGLLQGAHQQAAFVIFQRESVGGNLRADRNSRQLPVAVRPRNRNRQTGRRDRRAFLQDHGPLDGVAQFANVARPIVRDQQLRRGIGDILDIAFELAIVVLDEKLGHRHDVFRALAQGRNQNLDDVQPEIEILAEPAFLDGLAQILVGGRNHPQIEVNILQPAQPPERLLSSTRSSLACNMS